VNEPVRARDVQVDKLFRARCHRPGCGWTGGEHATFADASAERPGHLERHSLAEDGNEMAAQRQRERNEALAAPQET